MKKSISVILVFVLVLSLLAGCGSKAEDPTKAPAAPDPSQAVPAADPVQEDPSSLGPTQTATVSDPDPDVIRVSSIEELLEAIAPDADIYLEPGEYNMSSFVSAQDTESWNEKHPYVKIGEVFDGEEVTIIETDGLSITSDGYENTSIVIEPRYAFVFCFNDCNDLTLSGITLGHTDTGTCQGGVVSLQGCSNVNIDNMDLFGCGTVGVSCTATDNVTVTDSIIRDCDSCAGEFYECRGKISFTDCSMTGNGWGFFISADNVDADISCTRCKFGQNESNYFAFADEDMSIVDCELMEPTIYPDVDPSYAEGDGEQFDFIQNLRATKFDSGFLTDANWGFYPSPGGMRLKFNTDGTGTFTGYYEQPVAFTWSIDDSNYVFELKSPDAKDVDGATGGLLYDYTLDESPLYLILYLPDEDYPFYFEAE